MKIRKSLLSISLGISTMILLVGLSFASSVFSTGEAAQHVGEYATVQGTVTEVYVSRKGHVFLDMDGRYPNNAFSGVIFREYASLFPNVEDLQGKVVRVAGAIQLYKGKPEIIIREKSQVQVVR